MKSVPSLAADVAQKRAFADVERQGHKPTSFSRRRRMAFHHAERDVYDEHGLRQ